MLVTSLKSPQASSPLPVPREQWEALSKDQVRQVHPRKFSLSAGRPSPPTKQLARTAESETAGHGSELQAGKGLASLGRGPTHVCHTGQHVEGLSGWADWGLSVGEHSLTREGVASVTGSPCLRAPRVPVLGGRLCWNQTACFNSEMLSGYPARLLDAGHSLLTPPLPGAPVCREAVCTSWVSL